MCLVDGFCLFCGVRSAVVDDGCVREMLSVQCTLYTQLTQQIWMMRKHAFEFAIEKFSMQKLIKNCNFPVNWICLDPIFSHLFAPSRTFTAFDSYRELDLHFHFQWHFSLNRLQFNGEQPLSVAYNTVVTKSHLFRCGTTYTISPNVKIHLANFSMDLVWN